MVTFKLREYGISKFAMIPFDVKYKTSYFAAVFMFAISLTAYEMLANRIFQKLNLEN